VLCSALPLLGARPTQAAATFTVNLVGDAPDTNRNDGKCDASAGAGMQCTIRAAIQQANATSARDTIRFSIPGPGVRSVKPVSALPSIAQPLIIDGYSQPGAKRNTKVVPSAGTNAVLRIELDGSRITGDDGEGLFIEAPNVVVRGLVVNRFPGVGIIVKPSALGTRVTGCFIGTDPSGRLARGNGSSGIQALAPNAVVGGAAPADRNLIAGNGFDGVSVTFAGAAGRRVEGNLIGTDKTGAAPLGNARMGINASGSSTTIGGPTGGAANVIAFNGDSGVLINDVGHRVLRNAIFANGDIGIDLTGNGLTPNDPGDTDTGGNNQQNTPLITVARQVLSGSFVSGGLNSTPNATFTVQFFVNPDGGDEGRVFLGQQVVTTDGGGNASVSLTPARHLAIGETVTATATSAGGDTSEFSPPRTVQ
jgi:hypothetical protein